MEVEGYLTQRFYLIGTAVRAWSTADHVQGRATATVGVTLSRPAWTIGNGEQRENGSSTGRTSSTFGTCQTLRGLAL